MLRSTRFGLTLLALMMLWSARVAPSALADPSRNSLALPSMHQGLALLDAPTISQVRLLSASPIPTYSRVEIGFVLTTVASNPYLPYDGDTPPGVEAGIGVSVDLLLLPPGASDWSQAQVLPAFYYQPVQEVGTGSRAALLPVGPASWRARFSTGEPGVWRYRVRATDAGGTSTSAVGQFSVIASDNPGYVRVSPTDNQAFEFSNGEPFSAPMITANLGPFNALAEARENIPLLAQNGIRLVRWFPNSEGSHYFVAPFGDQLQGTWGHGDAWISTDAPDVAAGKRFSFVPYFYSAQRLPLVPGKYRLSFRAKVAGEQVLRVELGDLQRLDIGSSSGTLHERNGRGDVCDLRQDGWHGYVLEGTNLSAASMTVAMRALYMSTDAPAPYDQVQHGLMHLSTIVLQRDETGQGAWGPNLLTRSDPDTYNYVDQRSAALLDEILSLSEEHGLYHKLTLFHRNDQVLNRMLPDGSVTSDWDEMNVPFYSAEGQQARWYEDAYVRYFVARWSYSPALHSLELANENHLTNESYEAGWHLAEYVHSLSPRHVMMTNSFWGWFVGPFFADVEHRHLLDYADKHWYASVSDSDQELISNTWQDSAELVREAWRSFVEYRRQFNYQKPIMRGESGVGMSGTQPQHPDIQLDPMGTYYHKKVWAHVGSPQYSLDGEWYPRLFDARVADRFPNETRDTQSIYGAYERYMTGEPINNGHQENIGSDLAGDAAITVGNLSGSLRAWGVRDLVNGRLLLWVDNADDTWLRAVHGPPVAPASGPLTLAGLMPGNYAVAWWDTVTGRETHTTQHRVGIDGSLTLTISTLARDVALKIVRTGGCVGLPVKQPLALSAGWNLVSVMAQPTTTEAATILAPVAALCDVAWAYDASSPSTPWRSYCPAAPPYANSLQQLDITQGLWLHLRAPAALLLTGITSDVDIPLQAGWNLVGYPRTSALDITAATASISDQLTRIMAYQSQPDGGHWQLWDVALPPEQCELQVLEPGRGYWVEVDSACLWQIP